MYYCRSVVDFFCYRPSIEAMVAVTFILVILSLILIGKSDHRIQCEKKKF